MLVKEYRLNLIAKITRALTFLCHCPLLTSGITDLRVTQSMKDKKKITCCLENGVLATSPKTWETTQQTNYVYYVGRWGGVVNLKWGLLVFTRSMFPQ